METLGNKLEIKTSKTSNNIFVCETCDYICSKRFNLDRHILTASHIKEINRKEKGAKKEQTEQNEQNKDFSCEKCNKTYQTNAGLWKHKKKCYYDDNIVIDSKQTINNVIPIDHASLTEKMIELVMSKNQEFMNVFMDKIVHILPSITNNNTNSHNTNNNQFNIQMFLNEHCKNAMNISDFIKSLPLTAEHYENTKDNGLADTLTNLMVDGLNNLDVVERPIHCTDQKRKVMYVRDNNKWEKDTNNDIVTKNVKDLTCIHRANVDMWQEKNPKFNTDEDLQIALSVIIGNLFTDIIGEKKGISKLMKGVIDATYLDDNTKRGFPSCDTLASV